MDIASIGAAYEGLKVGKDILKSLYDSKVDAAAKGKIDSVMDKFGQAQDTLFSIREELFRLQSENNELKRNLADIDKWEQKSQQYKLVVTSGSAVVYEFQGEPKHYACPSCMESRLINILQNNRNLAGTYTCCSCAAKYPIDPVKQWH